MLWQKIRSGVMFIVSALTCPCHLPVVLPLVLAFLAGTPAAVWIAQNVGWVYGGMTLLFFLSLALGFRWMNQPAAECEPRLAHSINKPTSQTAAKESIMSSKAHAQKVTRPAKSSTIFLMAGLGAAIIFSAIVWNIWQNSRPPQSSSQAAIQPAAQVSVQLPAVPEVVPASDVGLELGKVSPDFSVPTLDGKIFTLSEQRGKPTVVFFMAYWCGSCIPEAIALGKLQQEYGDKISIAAVNVDPSATWETIEQFKQAAGNGALVWASDTDQKVTLTYQLRALDTTFILDGEGRVVYRDEISTQYETLKAELEKLTQ